MMMCRIDMRIPDALQAEVGCELRLLADVLEALDGELVGANLGFNQQSLSAVVRVESEMLANDIFEASRFAVEQVAYLYDTGDNTRQTPVQPALRAA